MKTGNHWGCFKRCSDCQDKISSTDSHLNCLFCLGENHIVNSCEICKMFSCQTRRNRAARLQQALLVKAFTPMESSDPSGKPTSLDSMSAVSGALLCPVLKTAPSTPASTPVSTKSASVAAIAGSKTQKFHWDKDKKGNDHKEKSSHNKAEARSSKVSLSWPSLKELPPLGTTPLEDIL